MLRRFVESSLALAALIALSPLFCIVAIGIRLSSPGPIFYRASRIGLDGAYFTMFKFRTMHTDQQVLSSRITAGKDPRIFAFGAFLRRSKMDELPQLINILKGEMAFVGPRPEDPKFVENNYTPEQLETLRVLPGLTSPGSLFYYTQGEKCIDDGDPETSYVKTVLGTKLALELVYIREASPLYDLRLVFRTLWVLLGVLAGRTNFPEQPEMGKIYGLNSRPIVAAVPQNSSICAVPSRMVLVPVEDTTSERRRS